MTWAPIRGARFTRMLRRGYSSQISHHILGPSAHFAQLFGKKLRCESVTAHYLH
jgi:hypothetical protein